ncbi:ParM/StbA family protein [Gottfriedia acidiceleris]|uniref:ParM/StbA family protein n=1 Tax=Gottfriedia acidiceleris TaxID=371036 RepID=UPI002F26431A
MRIGVDPGNKEIKVAAANGAIAFNSCLGEWRERKLTSSFSENDMEIEWRGKRYFLGDLAENESRFKLQANGISKVHDEGVLRVLIALYQFESDVFDITVSQPIKGHTDRLKEKFKAMLLGNHELIVNGRRKEFYIENVGVSAEGAVAYFTTEKEYLTRIIDIGSGTINGATIKNGKFIDLESFTIQGGMNDGDPALIADVIHSKLKGLWSEDDSMHLIGGGAESVSKHLNFPGSFVHYPFENEPKFANAIGLYLLGELLHERGKRG